ncbi:MAG: YkoP family protein [Bacillota bacterium]
MRSYFLSFWNILDPLYYLLTKLEYIDCHSGIFRVRLTKIKGKMY